jgi:DNA repair protein RecN (Recombination protein N)
MLQRLTIENFAIIERLTQEFAGGLIVVTGETGAGKSILIDALSLVLGERADTTMIRTGETRSVVEASFDAHDERIDGILRDSQVELQPELILRREVNVKGGSRCFINDSPVTVSVLKSVGDRLVDIHGQHEHQSLLRAETHIDLLDAFGDLNAARDAFRSAFDEFTEARSLLLRAVAERERIDERRIIIEHQLKTIADLDPQRDEDEAIERDLAIAEHAERMGMLTAELLDRLYDGESNAVDMLGRARRTLGELVRIDPGLAGIDQELGSAIEQVRDVAATLRTRFESIDFSTEHCERMRSRLAALNALKRAMRCTLAEIIERRAALMRELDSMDNIDDRITALEKRTGSARSAASDCAVRLSEGRRRAAKEMSRKVKSLLNGLGMKDVVFHVEISNMIERGRDGDFGPCLVLDGQPVRADEKGIDSVEFFIATNVGEDIKPLARTVSGGEVSRIMLTLKSLTAGRNAVPVMVFDEIDTGVSGATASKVGRTLRDLAMRHQVIAITHLPQIAAMGQTHFRVEKRVLDHRTVTDVRQLSRDEKTLEVARLISGDKVTDAALASARELITNE